MSQRQANAIIEAVAALDEQRTLALVRAALDGGMPSVEITRAAEQGMRRVGERYERLAVHLSSTAGRLARTRAYSPDDAG
ncbi:MAG: hypothetical protein M1274_06710, partial [Actinobacteria bacterium]|nr:hypothetical protein [Actinomycetota bacterium]